MISRTIVRVTLFERHFKHTQTYLSANGRSFVMVVGVECTDDGLPDAQRLKALLFQQGAGVAMNAGTWHEFPLAIEDDTRFVVVLRKESHFDSLKAPLHPLDARGPDLERYDMQQRANIAAPFYVWENGKVVAKKL
jgi:ureidoglycolate lyase